MRHLAVQVVLSVQGLGLISLTPKALAAVWREGGRANYRTC